MDIGRWKPRQVLLFPDSLGDSRHERSKANLFFDPLGLRSATDEEVIHLPTLLASIGCPHAFKPGGVLVFLTGRTIKTKKFIQDCFRFTQILYLLGTIVEVPKTWLAEMPCFALALTANGIDYDLIDVPEFVPQHPWEQSIAPGSLYHYYHDLKDGGDGAFHGSKWYKQLFFHIDFLNTDMDGFHAAAQTDHGQYFFELAKQAQQRLGYVSVRDRS